ncbi:MAG: PIN domain-containing protein [Gemmatimonadetes bacterium]|nr:PIN domain-containing protein [Gemmatimonadota bacterium]
MSARSFLDTNVLVYTDDADAPVKQSRALELLHRTRLDGSGVLSTQILQEYFSAATRKLGVPARLARRKIELFARFDVVLVDLSDILGAIDLHRLHQISFWDSLVIRAALRSGCSLLYTEDLQPALRIEGLEIVDPFA